MSSRLRFKNKIVCVTGENMVTELDDLGKEGYEIKAAVGIYLFLQKKMTQAEIEDQEDFENKNF